MLTSSALPLVGRDGCVEVFADAVKWVRKGRFGVVPVSGEPGIGKTRLLAEAARLAAEAGFLVCAGHGTQFERAVPLALFAGALDALGAGGASPLDALLAGPADRPLDRVRGYAALKRLVERAGRGVALILDDLHWADQASLELTEYLIRHPPAAPVLMIVAFRSAQSPARIVDAIGHLDAGVRRVRLDPLTETDFRALLPDLADRRRDLLMRASRGNPLYLKALLRLSDLALAELVREHCERCSEWTDESTRQILGALSVDLAELDGPVRQVAHAVAVIGDHAAIDLVAHVAELPVATVAAALDQLCGAGLGDMDGAWFRFQHPLMRTAAHDLAGPARRVRAHARAAEYLRAHGGPPQLLAHHVERSAQYGDENAAVTLLDAGESMVYRAPGTAVRWLGTALRILAPTSRVLAERPAVVLQYARALGLAGELDLSRQVIQDLLRDGHPLRAEAAAFGLVIARLRGDIDTAGAILRRELRGARGQPMAEGKLRVQLAALAAVREDAGEVDRQAQRALHLLDDRRPALSAAAQALRGWGALNDGRPATARACVTEAARLVDTVSDVTLRPHVELFGPLAWVETRLGDITSATRHLARAYEVIDQAGHSSALPYLLVVDAALQARLGHLRAALDLAAEAALTADHMGSLEMRAMADAVRLQPLLWTEGPAAAVAVAEGLAAAGRPHSRTWWRVAQLNLVIAHSVAEDVRPCLDLLTDPHMEWPDDPPAAVVRHVASARMSACAKDIDAAIRSAERAESVALAAGLAYETGCAWLAKAAVAARADDLDRAVVLADRAAARFAATDAPLDEARARHLAAVVLARAGHTERSHDEFGRAKAGSAACDARWLSAVISRDQRRCAARLSRHGKETPASTLTSRERQIAELVAVGLSNQEVADRLFLSRRTVESHLSRIYSKLAVRSRAALARRLGG